VGAAGGIRSFWVELSAEFSPEGGEGRREGTSIGRIGEKRSKSNTTLGGDSAGAEMQRDVGEAESLRVTGETGTSGPVGKAQEQGVGFSIDGGVHHSRFITTSMP